MSVRSLPIAHPPARALSGLPAPVMGIGFGLAAVAMWAGYLAFARAGILAGLKPQDFVLLRYATAGLVMLPWLLRNQPRSLGGIGWGRGLVLALLAGPLFIFVGVSGYVHAPLSHGAVIQPATITLGSLLAAVWLLGERGSVQKVLGAGILVGGLVLIASVGGVTGGPDAWRGDILFVGAGLLWVTFTLLLRHWGVGAVPATAAVSVISAAIVIPGFVAFETFERIAALTPLILTIQIVVQGVFSGVLAVLAYGASVQVLGASKAALFPALVPAAALIIGIPVTGEWPGLLEWAGCALVSGGLVVAMTSK